MVVEKHRRRLPDLALRRPSSFVVVICAFYVFLYYSDTINYFGLCNRSVLRRRNHPLTGFFLETHREHAVLLLQEIIPHEVPFDGSRSICHACWVRLSRDVHRQRDQQVQDQLPEQPEDQPNQQDHDQGPSNQQGEQEVYNDGQD
ncbi:hypothetical protein HW555_010974, partial [Spodoptera exigua]